jgi:hypothetical protein
MKAIGTNLQCACSYAHWLRTVARLWALIAAKNASLRGCTAHLAPGSSEPSFATADSRQELFLLIQSTESLVHQKD